jgi:hypothetical protein
VVSTISLRYLARERYLAGERYLARKNYCKRYLAMTQSDL